MVYRDKKVKKTQIKLNKRKNQKIICGVVSYMIGSEMLLYNTGYVKAEVNLPLSFALSSRNIDIETHYKILKFDSQVFGLKEMER